MCVFFYIYCMYYTYNLVLSYIYSSQEKSGLTMFDLPSLLNLSLYLVHVRPRAKFQATSHGDVKPQAHSSSPRASEVRRISLGTSAGLRLYHIIILS